MTPVLLLAKFLLSLFFLQLSLNYPGETINIGPMTAHKDSDIGFVKQSARKATNQLLHHHAQIVWNIL